MYDTFTSLAVELEGVVLDCGHYVPEERPHELVDALLSFWSRHS
jgi:pimeloyl-ACP methyl ester carboxylesterase